MPAMDNWIAGYIGIPYKDHGRTKSGADCWGIARLIHEEILGNILPLLSVNQYATVTDLEGVNAAYRKNLKLFDEIPLESRELGDLIVFRIKGLPVHVGVVITDMNMVHTLPGHDSVWESYIGPNWNRRIEGAYRWGA